MGRGLLQIVCVIVVLLCFRSKRSVGCTYQMTVMCTNFMPLLYKHECVAITRFCILFQDVWYIEYLHRCESNRHMGWSWAEYVGCEVIATKASIDYMRRMRVMTQTVCDLPQKYVVCSRYPRVQTDSLLWIVSGPISVHTVCEFVKYWWPRCLR